jgi:hypothetical protein
MYLCTAVKNVQSTSYAKSEFPCNIFLIDIPNPRSLILFNISLVYKQFTVEEVVFIVFHILLSHY